MKHQENNMFAMQKIYFKTFFFGQGPGVRRTFRLLSRTPHLKLKNNYT